MRPSPDVSATLFNVGTIKRGNDGNDWIILENSKNKRWTKYDPVKHSKYHKESFESEGTVILHFYNPETEQNPFSFRVSKDFYKNISGKDMNISLATMSHNKEYCFQKSLSEKTYQLVCSLESGPVVLTRYKDPEKYLFSSPEKKSLYFHFFQETSRIIDDIIFL